MEEALSSSFLFVITYVIITNGGVKMLNFYFNNKYSEQERIYLKDRPVFPIATEDIKSIDVLGRTNGTLTVKTGNYKDISIQLNLRCITSDYVKSYNHIMHWITHIEDNKLTFTENIHKTYNVKSVVLSDLKNNTGYFDFRLDFKCEPFLKSNDLHSRVIKFGEPFNITTDLKCPCTIELHGVVGIADSLVLKINKVPFVIYDVIGDMVIDSNILMCYKTETYTNIQTSYDFPFLNNGINIIECEQLKDGHFTLTVNPLLRY